MQPLLLLTQIDVRRSEVAGSSRATTIAKMTIPPVRLFSANHNPGGSVLSVDYTIPRVQPIEPAFSVKGIDTDVFGDFGDVVRWEFAAALRNKKTNKAVPFRATIEGVVTEWTPDETDPAEFLGCNHLIKEVKHFEFSIDNQEIWYVDADERIIRRMGRELTAGDRAALGA